MGVVLVPKNLPITTSNASCFSSLFCKKEKKKGELRPTAAVVLPLFPPANKRNNTVIETHTKYLYI